MRSFAITLALLTILAACTSARPPAPAAQPPAAVAPAAPTKPVEAPPPPPPPDPSVLASAALEAGRYEEVCAVLATEGFSPEVCEWMAATARNTPGRSLPSRTLEKFLRAQHVRRVGGSIVGFYDEANNEYEVRVGGRVAILSATETSYSTTGHFSLWAQSAGTSEETLNSGRDVSIPVYREWPLFKAIRDTATARGDDAAPAAVALFSEVLRGWPGDYCYIDTETQECWVPPAPEVVDGGVASAEVDASVPAVSDERRRECRRSCGSYLECRNMGFSFSECRDDMTSACRVCREEGAVR